MDIYPHHGHLVNLWGDLALLTGQFFSPGSCLESFTITVENTLTLLELILITVVNTLTVLELTLITVMNTLTVLELTHKSQMTGDASAF